MGAGWHSACEEGLAPATLAVEPPMRPLFQAMRHPAVMRTFNRLGAVRVAVAREAVKHPADRHHQQRIDEHDDQEIDHMRRKQRIAAKNGTQRRRAARRMKAAQQRHHQDCRRHGTGCTTRQPCARLWRRCSFASRRGSHGLRRSGC